MQMRFVLASIALLLMSSVSSPRQVGSATLQTRAEHTNYEETSRYDDVIHYITELQKRSPLLRVQSFGYSHEGRALPLMILSEPPVSTPREAAASGMPVVFVMANIHAGEVEGKEAVLKYAQRVLLGDSRRVLEKIILYSPEPYGRSSDHGLSPRQDDAGNRAVDAEEARLPHLLLRQLFRPCPGGSELSAAEPQHEE